ncbi:S-adenosyl-L-methionine-dependent methyltransferase [Globomyces pollinis-pini]|nr:S-adenosyl-L-methionine-dependent methyltransferase [Globomyces pollinis-pini]
MKNFYDTGAAILGKLYKQQGTIKALVMAEKVVDKKLLYAVICETLKYRQVIELIMENSGIAKAEKKLSKPLLTILIYDLLFGKGIKSGGAYKPLVLKHRARLNAELVKIKIKRRCKDNKDLIPDHIRNAIVIPRYVRVNTIKVTVENTIQHFTKNGYNLISFESMFENNFPAKSMCKDKHLPELLVLPPSADLHEDDYLLKGNIILQDKASCFPAFVLNAPKNSVCIDGCAAPGNKTSHLSAIMENTGKIFAFDMDRKRLDTLERLTGRAGCKNIDAVHGNFLETNPMDKRFANVEYMLLDPSCSGSGIVGRMDHLVQDIVPEESNAESAEDRVKSLAEFQKEILLHAFKFPKVKRIVYSTCSKHNEENELVVKHVLEENKAFRLVQGSFPTWDRRGVPIIKGAKHVIRTLPEEDKTIGFFVAHFERKQK